jgi:hypothetical protein
MKDPLFTPLRYSEYPLVDRREELIQLPLIRKALLAYGI